jgi:hypothetical protein
MNPRTSHEQQHPPQWLNQTSENAENAEAEPPEPLPALAGRDQLMLSTGARSTTTRITLPSTPALATITRQAETSIQSDAASSLHKLPTAERVTMPVVIDAGLMMPLQRAVCGGHVAAAQVLRIEPIPRSNNVKVLLALTRSTVDGIMVAIMHSLPSAMFGRISSA